MAKCETCHGIGEIQATTLAPAGRGEAVTRPVVVKRTCSTCRGTGQIGTAKLQAIKVAEAAKAEHGGVNPLVWRVVVASAALAGALYFAL